MENKSISKSQNTTNYSERDINQQFKLAEFNKIFEQNNLALANKDKINETPPIVCPKSSSNPKILFIIVCVFLIIGILLLLYNNFIKVEENSNI